MPKDKIIPIIIENYKYNLNLTFLPLPFFSPGVFIQNDYIPCL